MADAPENLMLIQLREISAELRGVPVKFDEHDKRFDNIDKGREAFQVQLTHTFGLAGMANSQAQHVDAKVADATERQKKFAADLKRLEVALFKG